MKELVFLKRTSSNGRDIKYVISTKGCWECTSHKGIKNYPVASIEGTQMYLNRYSYLKFKGFIPLSKIVRHTCDNPLCINPEHLILGTHKDNMLDKKERNRCNSPKGINQAASKLTEQQVLLIRKEKGSYRELAKKYNVSYRTIGDVKKRIMWKHI